MSGQQGSRWWQDMVDLCRLQLQLKGCGSAERLRQVGDHRKRRAEGEEIRLGQHTGLGVGEGAEPVQEIESKQPERERGRTSRALLQKWQGGGGH